MLHYGGATPKKHFGYSNSPAIASLWMGRLTGWTKVPKQERHAKKTTTVYVDKQGKRRYKGNHRLRKSEWGSQWIIQGCVQSQVLSLNFIFAHPDLKYRQ